MPDYTVHNDDEPGTVTTPIAAPPAVQPAPVEENNPTQPPPAPQHMHVGVPPGTILTPYP
jgi:hypothetical protein